MCRELFASSAKHYSGCPIRMFPKCHPKAHYEVFIDPKHRTVTLCCSKCDRPLPSFKIKGDNGNKKA